MARRTRSVEQNGNIYFTSNRGPQKLEGPNSSFLQAGLPKALDLVLSLGGGGNWLVTGKSVAYRVLWGIRDKNFNYTYGPPSQRAIIYNPGANNSVQLFNGAGTGFAIPAGITSDHFFQVYRTKSVTGAIDPGDEMFICYERNPNSTEIANGLVTGVVDLTADEMLGAALYTNATQEGIEKSNFRPPYCTDITTYRDHVIYANTKDVQRFKINMIGTAANLVNASIIINGMSFTGKNAENIAAAEYQVFTAGTPAVNVDSTARSLVRVINGWPGNTTIYAFYTSEFNEVPGRITLESRNLGDAPWYVKVSDPVIPRYFSPQLPFSDNENFKSSDSAFANSLMVSKQGQPEHVPLIYKFFVGSRLEEIQRVIALRDSVIIIKDNSIYRLVGSTVDNFQISLLDNTVSIISRDSAAVINNSIFMLTNQGFVSISDNGVQVMSRKIESDVLNYARAVYGTVNQHESVGIGHESDRLYLCSVGTGSEALCYAYNAFSECWTRWIINPNCFSVFGDRLYYGLKNNFGHVLKQRIDVKDSPPVNIEYCDPTATINIAAVDVATNSITATVADSVNWNGYYPQLGRGWKIIDTVNTREWFVLSWAGPGQPIFLDNVNNLAAGVYTAYRSIPLSVGYTPRHLGAPFEIKQWSEVHLDLGLQDAREYSYYINTEKSSKSGQLVSDFNVIAEHLVPLDYLGIPNYFPHNKQRITVGKGYIDGFNEGSGVEFYLSIKNNVSACVFQIKGAMVLTRGTGSNRTGIGGRL